MGHSRITYELIGGDACRFTLEVSQDGQRWLLFQEGN